jgi:hypothetical protein
LAPSGEVDARQDDLPSPGIAERARWDDNMTAYEDALTATSTPWAPWYVVPADRKWLTRALVAAILVDTIQALGLRWPEVSEDERKPNAEARRQLEAEAGEPRTGSSTRDSTTHAGIGPTPTDALITLLPA